MTSPRGRRRRNIYPLDPNDPNLKWCKDCEFPYMPAGGCKTHEDRCLTCCAADPNVDCMVRISTGDLLAAREEMDRGRLQMSAAERAAKREQVQADIDALYGKDGER